MTRRVATQKATLNIPSSLCAISEDRICENTRTQVPSFIPSRFTLPPLPKLEKRNAVHVCEAHDHVAKINPRRNNGSTYIPDYTIIDKYGSYPYIKYSKLINSKYIEKETTNLQIPSVITDLCYKYLFMEQDGIFQLAYLLSKILSVSGREKSENNGLAFSFGFKGIELINKMKNNIKGFESISKTGILNYCNLLIRNKYIKPINTSLGFFGGCYDTLLANGLNVNNNRYEFNHRKMKLFSDYVNFKTFYDRLAWNIGSIVEINRASNGWREGQIVEIGPKKKKITVVFTTKAGQILGKSVNRFNFNVVRSTEKFINNRMKWEKNKPIEIYSRTKHQWCKGIIKQINTPSYDKPYIDDITVIYNNTQSKRITRWSADLRNVSNSPSFQLQMIKSGSKVQIWSKSAAKWIIGHVKVCIPMVKCVIVKYARSEKIVQVTSNELQFM